MENVKIIITDVEGEMVHFVVAVNREDGHSHVAGMVTKGDVIDIVQLASRDYPNNEQQNEYGQPEGGHQWG